MIEPKKSLGQHFLTNRNYCTRIADLAGIKDGDTLLEIGPGTGALTEVLLEQAAVVHAVEFDRDMVRALEENFRDQLSSAPPRLILHQANVLRSDWQSILCPGNEGQSGNVQDSVKAETAVVGNLPYNIATRILEHSIKFKHLFRSFTCMTQKEVSLRIQAAPGSADYGYFSLLMDFNFERIRGFDVPPGAFNPPPKVISHVMQLRPRFLETGAEQEFITITKAAFSHRRKTIFNNLKLIFPNKKALSAILEECGISEKSRPQELGLEEFLSVSEVSRGMLSFRS